MLCVGLRGCLTFLSAWIEDELEGSVEKVGLGLRVMLGVGC